MWIMTGPCVYRIECKNNGRAYVGSTSCNAANRIGHHKHKLRHKLHGNKELQNDWDLYGEEAFDFKVGEQVALDKVLELEHGAILELGVKAYNMVMPPTRHGYWNLEQYKRFAARKPKGPEKAVLKFRVPVGSVELVKEAVDKALGVSVPSGCQKAVEAKETPTRGVRRDDELARLNAHNYALAEAEDRLVKEIEGLKLDLEDARSTNLDANGAYWRARALKAEAYAAAKDQSQ